MWLGCGDDRALLLVLVVHGALDLACARHVERGHVVQQVVQQRADNLRVEFRGQGCAWYRVQGSGVINPGTSRPQHHGQRAHHLQDPINPDPVTLNPTLRGSRACQQRHPTLSAPRTRVDWIAPGMLSVGASCTRLCSTVLITSRWVLGCRVHRPNSP